jgi:hypothetical protein
VFDKRKVNTPDVADEMLSKRELSRAGVSFVLGLCGSECKLKTVWISESTQPYFWLTLSLWATYLPEK